MRLTHTIFAVSAILVTFAEHASAQSAGTNRFVAGEILVKFRPGIAAAAKADTHRVAGGRMVAEIARTNVQRVAVPAGDEPAAITRYQRNPNVMYAEPNFIRRFPSVTAHTPGTDIVPGDHYFGEQWALHNTGQEFYCIFPGFCFYLAKEDADIDAPEAWATTTGVSTAIKVAIIDSGIDYTHPDLAANYAGGADFTTGDNDPMDDHGHGTHVAGTIAAAMNNLTGEPAAEEGVVGVAPNALILAYKACFADGTCSDFAIEQGVARAIADGAKVINMSLGAPEASQSLSAAIQDAWNAGIVVVAAAGNDGTTALFYPAADANVISVGAFDEDHRRAPFSNYGNWVDISAPGNVIFSTYPMIGCLGEVAPPGEVGCYTWNSGTSMASPHVAGAAALVWSRGDVTTNSQVVDILLNSADPQGVDPVRLDSWTIHGGLNLHNAVSLGSLNVSPVADAGADQTVTDQGLDGAELVALNGAASSDADGSIVSYAWSEGNALIASEPNPSVWFAVGTHVVTLSVTDNRGAIDTDTVVITVQPGNTAPIAANTSATTMVGVPITLTLRATDVETCELVFAIVNGSASGTLGPIQTDACTPGSPNTDTARVAYTPSSTGTFTFTFSANDGTLVSNIGTATITVNAAPPSETLAVTGISPNVVPQNYGTKPFIISGTGFANGAAVTFANGTGGQAPRVISVVWNSSSQLTATVEIRSGGPKRNRQWDVVVANPGGSTATGAGLLTVTP
jgi:thermitase